MLTIVIRLAKVLLGASFLCIFSQSALAKNPESRFGLWVEAEGNTRPYRSQIEFEGLKNLIEEQPLTDLYCQIYRGGKAWFPSMVADDAPYRASLSVGIDPLRDTIKAAKKRGVRVHAWVNVLRIINNPDAVMFSVAGRSAAQVDSLGNSLMDYSLDGIPPGRLGQEYQLETQGIWLDPSSPAVRQYIVEVVRDLIIAYPDLDGIHLDMVRFPFAIRKKGASTQTLARPSFGYGPETLDRFYALSGQPAPEVTAKLVQQLKSSTAWKAWQRAQVSLLVFEIRELLNALAPEMELSVAAIAEFNRANNEAMQEWDAWIAGGLIDTVVPMSYNRDVASVKRQIGHAAKVAGKGQMLAGLGAWLMIRNPEHLIQQGKTALALEANGVVLFSYSNLASNEGRALIRKFSGSVFPASQDLSQNLRSDQR